MSRGCIRRYRHRAYILQFRYRRFCFHPDLADLRVFQVTFSQSLSQSRMCLMHTHRQVRHTYYITINCVDYSHDNLLFEPRAALPYSDYSIFVASQRFCARKIVVSLKRFSWRVKRRARSPFLIVNTYCDFSIGIYVRRVKLRSFLLCHWRCNCSEGAMAARSSLGTCVHVVILKPIKKCLHI